MKIVVGIDGPDGAPRVAPQDAPAWAAPSSTGGDVP
ncbi:MAG: hypothetical protein JWL64_2791 [Frankiales bacterium]|nr:hypothetical protein [Frankiales bacterium]